MLQLSVAGSPSEHSWPRSLWVGNMAPLSPITQRDASQRGSLLADVTELAVGAFLRVRSAVQ